MDLRFKDVFDVLDGAILVSLTEDIIYDIAVFAGYNEAPYDEDGNEIEGYEDLSPEEWLAAECDLPISSNEYYDIWMFESYLDGTGFKADTFFNNYIVDSISALSEASYGEGFIGVTLK